MACSLGTASEWGTYEDLGPVPPAASDSSRDSEPGGNRGSSLSRVPSLLVSVACLHPLQHPLQTYISYMVIIIFSR